jgi:hypothetical protein
MYFLNIEVLAQTDLAFWLVQHVSSTVHRTQTQMCKGLSVIKVSEVSFVIILNLKGKIDMENLRQLSQSI